MFIDVHCHIDLCKDFEKVIINAKKAGMLAVNNGLNIKSNRKCLELLKNKNVRAALGIYPIEALKLTDREIDSEIEFIRKNAGKIAAIGEVGLDFKETEEREKQISNFKKFIKLSLELNKPIIVHSRKAEKEAIDVLREMGAKRVIMHCFFGSMKLVDEIIKQGWSFSIPTSVCYNSQMQELAKKVPVGQILCETDSPYMHPVKGERDNEPALVVEGYKKIAEIKGLNLKEFEKIVEENYRRMFG